MEAWLNGIRLVASWDTVEWFWPWAFVALPIPLLMLFILPEYKPAQQRALQVPQMEALQTLSTQKSTMRRGWIGLLLLLLMWFFLLAAIARPQYFGEPQGVPVSGRDLMLTIDTSGSMSETDLYGGSRAASRLAVVKYVAKNFISRRPGDRIGLILFGEAAYIQTPLTHDHATLQHFLDETVVGLAGRSTAIGDAIGLGIKRLRQRPAEARVMILLTDGESNAGIVTPLEAAAVAAKNDIRIHTIGVGPDPGSSRFGLGLGMRRSELDEPTLRAIADNTGGTYFRARNVKELENIYAQIDILEPTEHDDKEFRPVTELYVYPLSLALLISLCWAAAKRAVSGRYV
ncbi:MAG: VWA domain-containing protein [Gammaproteobacteria bacterium]|nr:VWA domain-containing protein [Gammaproteobacteria bacterium]